MVGALCTALSADCGRYQLLVAAMCGLCSRQTGSDSLRAGPGHPAVSRVASAEASDAGASSPVHGRPMAPRSPRRHRSMLGTPSQVGPSGRGSSAGAQPAKSGLPPR